jgi:hypothetical protein
MEEAIVGHLKLTIVRMLYSQGFTKSSTHTVAVLTDLLDRYLKLLVASCARLRTPRRTPFRQRV